MLVEGGANIEAREERGEKNTPLLIAAKNGNAEIVKVLLEKKANIEARNDAGDTPLFVAAKEGHEEIVKMLLNAEANLDVTDVSGETPLSIATKNGHVKVVEILREKIEATVKKFNAWLKV